MIAVRYHFNQALQNLVDLIFMTLPQPRPTPEALRQCKLVSHRGEHDNRRIRENTMAAFSRVHAAGVWGIEFDLRWTRDLEPVILHDPDTRRVFGRDIAVAEVEFPELRRRLPEVPTLAEVIERFGGEMHLMVEIKADDLGAEARKRARIEALFSRLSPVEDYHFLALAPELFTLVEFAGSEACLPVAEFNMADISQLAQERSYAGISGQYLLMSSRLIQRHRRLRQKVGTGFSASRFCFYRELNRGVDWIFTNHALKLTAIRQSLMRDG